MASNLRLCLLVIGWVAAITLIHLGLNTRALDFHERARGAADEPFRVGFLPVT